MEVVRGCSGTDTPVVNVSEYLDYLLAAGVGKADFPALGREAIAR